MAELYNRRISINLAQLGHFKSVHQIYWRFFFLDKVKEKKRGGEAIPVTGRGGL
jgi:hypothetical protein